MAGIFSGAAVVLAEGTFRQWRTLRIIRSRFERATLARDRRIHVIAHSFGTLLFTRLLALGGYRVSNVIFVNGVVSPAFDWQGLLGRQAFLFEQLRNELSTNDWAVWFSWIIRRTVRGSGPCGRVGFWGDPQFIHRVDQAFSECRVCRGRNLGPRVHNVVLGDFDHDLAFLGPRHAFDLWLPFLWGTTAAEFQDFHHRCAKAAEADEHGQLVSSGAEAQLRQATYTWAGGRPLMEYIGIVAVELNRHRIPRLSPLDHKIISEAALREVWRTTVRALAENRKPAGTRHAHASRRLEREHAF